jgi:multidrug efflux system membrane fusion protein
MPVTPGLLERGRVSFIDNAVDAQTGTIKLKGTFDNSDQGLWPGLFVQVTLNLTSDENAIVVPAAAVQPSASGQYVYVIKPGETRTAEVRQVQVLRQQGEEVVIAKGLQAGEEVVTEGQLRLTPGAPVTDAQRGLAPGGGGEGGGRRGRRGGEGGNGGGNGERRGRGN